jgi:Fe-S cluster biogenesis protein NfuA
MTNLIAKIKGWFAGSKNTDPGMPGKEPFRVARTQPTPNPDSLQFIINQPVIVAGTKSFDSAESARGDALGEALFKIFGIENIFFKENFVTVNKSPVVGWSSLIGEITKALEAHLTRYTISDEASQPAADIPPILTDFTPDEFILFSDAQKREVIDAIFEHSIRPALAYDGGGLTLEEIKGNVIRIHYQGACGSCPSSKAGTLSYIETVLKEHLHPSLQVEAV